MASLPQLLERLKDKYSKRRSKDIVSLVKFFENPDSLSVVPDYQCKMPTKTTLINKAKLIHNLLFVMRMLFS